MQLSNSLVSLASGNSAELVGLSVGEENYLEIQMNDIVLHF